MTTNIAGIISVIFFYVIILVVGIWAGKKKKTGGSDLEESEEVMLAGRNIGMFVGIFTMTGKYVLWNQTSLVRYLFSYFCYAAYFPKHLCI